MSISPKFYRHHEIRRIRNELERDSFPRLQMLLLVSLTGASGFFASFGLLHAGLIDMWIRYLASFGFAYLAFLVLLWVWLRTRADDYADFADISGAPSSGSGGSSTSFSGKGGDFGGGGANGSFAASSDGSILGDSDNIVGDALGTAAEADEFAIPLAFLVIVGAIVFSSIFMVFSAPTLFAELLVDGVLSASLYRKLRGLDTRHWLETALRRTVLPFALTAAVVSCCGWLMSVYAPEAHSLGEVIAHAKLGN